jgi:uncharacterized membrane protein YccF (DUF307 family)
MATGAVDRDDAAFGRPLWVRAIWFLLVGWWLTAFTITVAYLFLVTIIGFPVAFWLFDRVPLTLTLKPRSSWTADEVSGTVTIGPQQISTAVRTIYFVLVGWWATALWIVVAYVLFVSIIGIPIGVIMLNAVPSIATLQRN